jgi:Anti-sigma factor NepR
MATENKKVPNSIDVSIHRQEELILPPLAQDEIGRRLRAVYGTITAEPLPEKFTDLLRELAKSDGKIEPERET